MPRSIARRSRAINSLFHCAKPWLTSLRENALSRSDFRGEPVSPCHGGARCSTQSRQSAQCTLSTKVWPQTRLWLHRQRELESDAPSRIGAGPKTAAMRLDDPAADGQPHARSIRFGGEKRIENALKASFGKANPAIAHGDKEVTILRPRRGNVEFATPLLHGLDAIEHEIHQNLLQLHPVRARCRKRRVELTAEGNAMAMRRFAQQNEH